MMRTIAVPTSATRGGETSTDPRAWDQLLKIGGAAAIGVIALIPIQVAAFLIWPTPTSPVNAFVLFREDPLGGLLAFDLLLMVSWGLSFLVLTALCVALWNAGPARIAVALAFELSAFAMYFSSNTAFSMLTLSDQYANATTEAERMAVVAAGQAMLALYTGTTFDVSYILSGAAALLVGLVMVRSTLFPRLTGYLMIAYAVLQVPPTAGSIGMGLAVISLLPMVAWLVLVARGLLSFEGRHHPSRHPMVPVSVG